MRILHIDSSSLDTASVTRHWTQATVDRLLQQHPGSTVEHVDLALAPFPHWTPEQASTAQSQSVMEQFLRADVVVGACIQQGAEGRTVSATAFSVGPRIQAR